MTSITECAGKPHLTFRSNLTVRSAVTNDVVFVEKLTNREWRLILRSSLQTSKIWLIMSLSDLPNPEAAANLIAQHRKRFNSKVCMAPHPDHEGSIVSAHTLSVESMLRKIAVDSHVYTVGQPKKMAMDTFPIEIHLRGLREVSVFNGFCKKHDRELFSCLENEPFRFARKQNFMLAYRALARECYLKRKQYESIPTPEDVAEIHNIEGELLYSPTALLLQTGSLRGAEDIETVKALFDKYLQMNAWDRVVTSAILFSETPTVLATATFQPFFDVQGTKLQDFENLDAKMSQISMSVIPTETGGAAIFSWLDSSNNAPRRFFESIVRKGDLTNTVLQAVLDYTENIAINPSWYENQSDYNKEYILECVCRGGDLFAKLDCYAPNQDKPRFASWGDALAADF